MKIVVKRIKKLTGIDYGFAACTKCTERLQDSYNSKMLILTIEKLPVAEQRMDRPTLDVKIIQISLYI